MLHKIKFALAGVALAVLLAGPASAATVVLTKALNVSLDTGAYSGSFQLGGLLADADGRTFTIASARLSATAFSAPTYGPPTVFALPKPPFVIPTLQFTEPKPTLIYDDQTIRTVLYADEITDRMHLSAYLQSAVGQVGDTLEETGQTHTLLAPDVVTDTANWIEIHRTSQLDNWTRRAIYGDIDVGFDVDASGLFLMNSFGVFDFSAFAFPGSIQLTGARLSLELTQTGGPPPGVAGVPEPETWALVIVGFGLTGAVLRRRRFSPAPLPVRRRPRSSR